MKKVKSPIYLRYEFSDEAGNPEGGDIFQFNSLPKVQEMLENVLKVAQSDNVTVNLTVGEETSFFGFLKKAGVSRKDAEREMVDADLAPMSSTKKPPKKKAAPKAKSKTATKTKKK